jgi:hypothetical protein
VEPEELDVPTEYLPDLSLENDLSVTDDLKKEEIPVPVPEKTAEELLRELNEPFDFITDKNATPEDEADEDITISSSEAEDLLKMYDEELKSMEEFEEEIKDDKGEIELDISHKEILDEFYDFEDDTDEDISKIEEISADSNDHDLLSESNDVAVPKIPVRQKNNFPNELLTYLKDKEIDKIVNSVFDEDREDFAITMDRITECSSYDEATEILKSVFLTYRVNPYSRDAVALTNAVATYFNQI